MTTLTPKAKMWTSISLAVALIFLAAIRSTDSSWLFGALGVAVVVKAVADVRDRDGIHRRGIGLLYLAVAAVGLGVYLFVSSR